MSAVIVSQDIAPQSDEVVTADGHIQQRNRKHFLKSQKGREKMGTELTVFLEKVSDNSHSRLRQLNPRTWHN